MQRTLRKNGVKTYEGDLCCHDLMQVAGGEEHLIRKPTRFMTNADQAGKELSMRCRGQHRHIELTGGSRTKRAQIFPDKLCRAIASGLIKQMAEDQRYLCSFVSDEAPGDITEDYEMEINERSAVNHHSNANQKHSTLTWSRRDYRTTRLKLPGSSGPVWSSCVRRITKDLKSGRIIEYRPVSEITGKEMKRQFKGNPRDI